MIKKIIRKKTFAIKKQTIRLDSRLLLKMITKNTGRQN